MKKPLISVIITAYGRKGFLKDALVSVASQNISRDKFEIFVVKNFSDAEIDKFCLETGAEIINSEESNVTLFRYAAIDRCRGEILCFLDDDDRWEKGKLEHVLEVFGKYRQLGLYRNSIKFIDHDGRAIENPYRYRPVQFSEHGRALYVESSRMERFASHAVNRRYDFNCSSLSIKKEILLRYRNFAPRIQSSFDSFMFYCTAISGYSFLVDDSELTLYRINDGSVSFSPTLSFSSRQIVTYNALLEMANFYGKKDLIKILERQLAFFMLINTIHKKEPHKREVLRLTMKFTRHVHIYKIMENLVTEIISMMYIIHPGLSISLYEKFTSVRMPVLQ
jgi:glycosyltransferase involved in cell wall biosynthesis